jgi:general stress protein 26
MTGGFLVNTIRQQILDITRRAHLATLATISEEGKPWVRYVIPRATDDLIIRIATRVKSRKLAHIRKNPEVHLTCGVSDPRNIETFLQIQGRAEFTTDQRQRESFWDPHLENVFDGPDDPEYGVLIITPYRIEVWKEGLREPDVWEA